MSAMSPRILRICLHVFLVFALFSMLFVLFSCMSTHVAPSHADGSMATTLLSTDPYRNKAAEHQTEVEPDIVAFGSTIVATFQVGRFTGGGSDNIGWATSSDGGTTWTNGFLPGITRDRK